MDNTRIALDTQSWVQQQFGTAQLGDQRRTKRLVQLATALAQNPAASLPVQLGDWASLKAGYRFLEQAALSHQALSQPHWQQTRQAASKAALVLMLQDTTEVDYTAHPGVSGLGPIGDGKGRGYLLHNVLAVVPDQPAQILGLAYQEAFLRQPQTKGQSSYQRQKRERESQIWARAVSALGTPPSGSQWVEVAEWGSDLFEFFSQCRASGQAFLVRVVQNRRIEIEVDARLQTSYLLDYARSLGAQGQQELALPSRHGQPSRQAQLKISFAPVELQAPFHQRHRVAIDGWVIRVWEPAPPSGAEGLEWVLLSSVATTNLEQAWQRVGWYKLRWLIEDYHQCLKTGCSLEQRQLQTAEGLLRLLAILAPIAVRLLQLREVSRLDPLRPACQVVAEEVVEVVAWLSGVSSEKLSSQALWGEIAKMGGYLGRKGDGPAGWQSLWRGWQHLPTLVQGMHLARQLRL